MPSVGETQPLRLDDRFPDLPKTLPMTLSHMLTLEWYGCGIVSGNTILMVDVPALMLKTISQQKMTSYPAVTTVCRAWLSGTASISLILVISRAGFIGAARTLRLGIATGEARGQCSQSRAQESDCRDLQPASRARLISGRVGVHLHDAGGIPLRIQTVSHVADARYRHLGRHDLSSYRGYFLHERIGVRHIDGVHSGRGLRHAPRYSPVDTRLRLRPRGRRPVLDRATPVLGLANEDVGVELRRAFRLIREDLEMNNPGNMSTSLWHSSTRELFINREDDRCFR